MGMMFDDKFAPAANTFNQYSTVFSLSHKWRKQVPMPVIRIKKPVPVLKKTIYKAENVPVSRFGNIAPLATISPMSRFMVVAKKKTQPAVPAARTVPEKRKTLILKTPAKTPAAKTAEPVKKRGTLKLKKKVDLPTITPISKRSSTNDLAAAFKAEMTQMTRQATQGTQKTLRHTANNATRRHPLSSKSWGELLAEAETKQQKKHDFDLAEAFRTEMAKLTGQTAGTNAPQNARPVPVIKPKTKTTSPRSQRKAAPRLVA